MRRNVARREVLAGLGTGVVGSLAGCSEAAAPGDDEPIPGDWPMFGYDAGNGGSSPDAPGPSGPGVRWRFELDRGANTSPAVVDGVVYVNTLRGMAYALKAVSGEPRWQAEALFPLLGTPAVAGDTVYVPDGSGVLHALTERIDSGVSYSQHLWRAEGDAGFTASPTVVDGRVYLGTFEGHIHAFDAGDGTRLWTDVLGDRVDVAPAVADGVVYALAPRGVVYAFDAATGDPVWETDLGVALTAAPVVRDGSLYVGSTDSNLYGSETRLFALDAATGEREWSIPLARGINGSPAVVDGSVLAGTWGGSLLAFDVATGDPAWETDLGEGVTGPPAVAGSTAFVGTVDRRLHAVDVGGGKPRWTFETGDGVPGPPAVAGDAVYLATEAPEVLAIGE